MRSDTKSKKILICSDDSYYLFSYLRSIATSLVALGYDVHYYTKKNSEPTHFSESNVKLYGYPLLIKAALRFSGYSVGRVAVWVACRIWVNRLKHKGYDWAIVPWDNKPLWYLISNQFRSAIIQNTFDLLDERIIFDLEKDTRSKIVRCLYNWFGLDLAPRFQNKILKHDSRTFVLDFFMGMRVQNLLLGCSGPDLFFVIGPSAKTTLLSDVGCCIKKIIVAGHPTFSEFIGRRDVSEAEISRLRDRYFSNHQQKKIISLFLSPSHLDLPKLREISNVFKSLPNPNALFVNIKAHPKTNKESIRQLLDICEEQKLDYQLKVEFSSERENFDMIQASDLLVIKQGTTGLLALLTNTPIIVYNLEETKYFDDLFSYLGFPNIARDTESLRQMVEATLGSTVESNKAEKDNLALCSKHLYTERPFFEVFVEALNDEKSI